MLLSNQKWEILIIDNSINSLDVQLCYHLNSNKSSVFVNYLHNLKISLLESTKVEISLTKPLILL